MMKASNIHFEMAERGRALNLRGILLVNGDFFEQIYEIGWGD